MYITLFLILDRRQVFVGVFEYIGPRRAAYGELPASGKVLRIMLYLQGIFTQL